MHVREVVWNTVHLYGRPRGGKDNGCVWVNIVKEEVLWRRVVLGGVRADAAIDRGGPTSVPLANWRPPRSAALHRHPAAVLAPPRTYLASLLPLMCVLLCS